MAGSFVPNDVKSTALPCGSGATRDLSTTACETQLTLTRSISVSEARHRRQTALSTATLCMWDVCAGQYSRPVQKRALKRSRTADLTQLASSFQVQQLNVPEKAASCSRAVRSRACLPGAKLRLLYSCCTVAVQSRYRLVAGKSYTQVGLVT